MNRSRIRFRDRQHEAKNIVLRNVNDGHGLRVRRSSGLDHGAVARIALRNHSIQRRDDPRIREESILVIERGFRCLQAADGCLDGLLGGSYLRFCFKIARMRNVDFLERNQARFFFETSRMRVYERCAIDSAATARF